MDLRANGLGLVAFQGDFDLFPIFSWLSSHGYIQLPGTDSIVSWADPQRDRAPHLDSRRPKRGQARRPRA